MDVPLKNAQIVWNYDGDNPNADPVRVMALTSGADNTDYISSFGACNLEFNETDQAGRLAMLFSFFLFATVEEGMDPKVIDDALVVIPEYRDMRQIMV